MGSSSEAKNAPKENTDKVMETVEIFMASKKKIQCKAINKPTITSFTKDLGDTLNDFFLIPIKAARKTAAKNIRYQTKKLAGIVIKAPKIAVKPQIKTMKCKLR
jgi:hypothetical protein